MITGPLSQTRKLKSIGAEDTFPEDLVGIDEMNINLDKIAGVVYKRLVNHSLKGRTITLKIKYSDFKIITRSKSFNEAFDEVSFIADTAKELLLATEPEGSRIRLLGISVSNFGERITAKNPASGQLLLFNTL